MGKKLTEEEIKEYSKDQNQGFDICSVCGEVELRGPMKEVSAESFHLICDECLALKNKPKPKAKDRNSLSEINGDINFLCDMKKYINNHDYDYVKQMIGDWINELEKLGGKLPVQTLEYTVELDSEREVNLLNVSLNGMIYFQLECLVDSPYSIEEEIQYYLDDIEDNNEYEFLKIEA